MQLKMCAQHWRLHLVTCVRPTSTSNWYVPFPFLPDLLILSGGCMHSRFSALRCITLQWSFYTGFAE